MRLNEIRSRYTISAKYNFPETWMMGRLEIIPDPTKPGHVVRKKDVDDAFRDIDIGLIEETVGKQYFPNYYGDFTKDVGDSNYYIKKQSFDAGKYPVVTHNSKGIVTSVKNVLSKENWGSVDYFYVARNTLPTRIENLGIGNALIFGEGQESKEGVDYRGNKNIPKRPIVLGDMETYSHDQYYKIGDIVTAPKGSDLSKMGFARMNGAVVKKADYPELYSIVGDYYGMDYGSYGGGAPWQNLDGINNDQVWDFPLTEGVATEPSFPFARGGFGLVVTKNKVFVFGGTEDGVGIPRTDILMSVINSSGVMGPWEKVGDLPTPLMFFTTVVIQNQVYLIGGTTKTNQHNPTVPNVIKADIDGNGDLVNFRVTNIQSPEIIEGKFFILKNKLFVIGFVPLNVYVPGTPITPNNKTRCYYSIIDSSGGLSEFVLDDEHNTMDIGYYNDILKNNSSFSSFTYSSLQNSSLFSQSLYYPINNDFTLPFNINANSNYVAASVYNISNRNNVIFSINNNHSYNGYGENEYMSKGTIDSLGRVSLGESILTSNGVRWAGRMFCTSKYVYRLGYLYSIKTINPNTPSLYDREKSRRFDIPLGLDDYTIYNNSSKKLSDVPPDSFTLPYMRDEIYNSEIYSFFIKVL